MHMRDPVRELGNLIAQEDPKLKDVQKNQRGADIFESLRLHCLGREIEHEEEVHVGEHAVGRAHAPNKQIR